MGDVHPATPSRARRHRGGALPAGAHRLRRHAGADRGQSAADCRHGGPAVALPGTGYRTLADVLGASRTIGNAGWAGSQPEAHLTDKWSTCELPTGTDIEPGAWPEACS